MLKDQFYTVLSQRTAGAGTIEANIRFHADHEIFKGHFPEVPIVPGVCTMQLLKEFLEQELNRSLTLRSAGIIKFLGMINPLETPEVDVKLSYTQLEELSWKVEAQLSKGEQVFYKVSKAIYC